MSTSVTLPALGESVTEGTVTRWLKQVGDTIEIDEPLLEVSTDKVDTEIPSPAAGVLLEISAAEDETVEVGAVLGSIGDADEAPSDGAGSDGAGSDGAGSNGAGAGEAGAGEAKTDAAKSDGGGAQQTGASEPAGQQESAPKAEPAPDEEESAAPSLDEEAPAPQAKTAPAPGGGTEVTLPALGESVTEGTVSRWLKQVGDTVEVDEPLLEVSTDKVDTEIPSPTAGAVLEIRVAEDETVEVGTVLAVVGEQGAEPAEETAPLPEPEATPEPEPAAKTEPEPEPEAKDAPTREAPSEEAPVKAKPEDESPSGNSSAAPTPTTSGRAPSPAPADAPKPPPPVSDSGTPASGTAASGTPASGTPDADTTYVTPLVRKLAAEHAVDLGSVTGTGVGGRIRKQDVLAAAETAKEAKSAQAAPAQADATAPAASTVEPSSLRGTTEKMSRLRKTIAKRMVESLQTSAQLTTVVEVDLTRVSRLRAGVKDDFLAREGVKLSYLPFLVKASVEALKVHPKINCTVDTEAGEVNYPASENVAIAVDTEKGLIVPVVRDAGDLSIAGIAKKIADLASRTRSNKLSPDDLMGGTFTITNTGSRGALFDTPIINQPQVAILGTGALVKRAVVMSDPDLGETIAVRDMMYLALSYDHRIVDGADAARFLSTLKERLEGGDFGSEFGL